MADSDLVRLLRITAVGVSAAALASGLGSGTASAHPFGEPQSVILTGRPTGVEIAWSAATDDVTALAAHLGAVGGQHIMVFEKGEYDAQASSVPAGIRLAQAAPVLADYLLQHIVVSAEGRRCGGELAPVVDVSDGGVRVDYDCGRSVSEVEVGVDMLADLHPSYRTVAEGPNGQRHVYTGDGERISWTLPQQGDAPVAAVGSGRSTTSTGISALLQLGSLAVLLSTGVVGWWILRRRRRLQG